MRRIAQAVWMTGALAAAVPMSGCRSLDGQAPGAFGVESTAKDEAPAPPPPPGPPGPPEPPKYHLDPGVTGYSHILGWVTQRFVYPGPLVERALIEAMSDMGIHSVKRGTHHKTVATFKGLLYDGRIILVELEPQGENTVVKIRIDGYGDEPKTKILLERMSIRLATLPQAVFPPFDPRTLSDSAQHRGMDIQGYRGAPLR
ncbi:MAG: hypothetical protein U0835_19330 [Isosphaeraceae bacterium]